MRRVVMEDLGEAAPVVVLQEGPDVLWIVNSSSNLKSVVESTARLVCELEVPLILPRRLRLLRWLIAPACRRVHACD